MQKENALYATLTPLWTDKKLKAKYHNDIFMLKGNREMNKTYLQKRTLESLVVWFFSWMAFSVPNNMY